tara:strand:+ start:67 stop:858 length:792 start_codon:yes stop_codon:yes gene_type:complete
MADTFDPYDENDILNSESLNTRFSSIAQKVNEVPANSNRSEGLGHNHIASLISNTRTQTKVLTPLAAKEYQSSPGVSFFCDQITHGYPGYTQTDFETGGNVCWSRISDSSGGSGYGTQYLTLDLSSLTVGENKRNSLLVMANIEYVRAYNQTRYEEDGYGASSGQESLMTIITTVSSVGVRTFHWRTLRMTHCVDVASSYFSVDISHRALFTTDANGVGRDIKEVEVLAASLDDMNKPISYEKVHSTIRFCQLTAVALHSKAN